VIKLRKINVLKEDLEIYLKNGMSSKEISEIYNCTPTFITKKIKHFGLKYNSKSEHMQKLINLGIYDKDKYTRIRNILVKIKDRCYNIKCYAYENYGGRGIRLCDEWLNNPSNFYIWSLNNGYSDDLSIDRIDNNGNYEPDNCRWVSMFIQANNRRNNHLVTIDGETKTIMEWSKYFKIPYDTLKNRVNKGWREEDLNMSVINKKSCKQSKEKGISWNQQINKWVVRISISGKRIYLGCRDTEEEAIKLKIDFLNSQKEENK
jgi:hypothetical protein